MKKSLIALAVAAGSIAAAQAAGDTTTLYGSIGYVSQIVEAPLDKTISSLKEHHWEFNQNRARLGVKGEEDLGNGLAAEFKFELENKGGEGGLNGTRDVYVGLKGDSFGTVRIGRQGSTWNVDENYFRSTKPAIDLPWTPGRSDKTIKYISPDFGGVTVAARIYADRNVDASLGIDQWDTSVEYKANGIFAQAAYGVQYDGVLDKNYLTQYNKRRIINEGTTESMGVQVGYENDDFGVFGNAQHQASVGTVYNLQGKYIFGQNELRAGFGFGDNKSKTAKDFYKTALGYQYNLSKRTSTWVEGNYVDTLDDNKDGEFSASVGIRHDF